MSGGKAKKRKKQPWRITYKNKTEFAQMPPCVNCGRQGKHYVGPSNIDRREGFFICQPRESILLDPPQSADDILSLLKVELDANQKAYIEHQIVNGVDRG